MYIIAGIVLCIIVLALTGKKSVHHEISINASTETVWQTLTDMDSYADWNPTLEVLEGEYKVGSKVRYRFHQSEGNSYEVGTEVSLITPEKLIKQQGGTPGVITYHHQYILKEKTYGCLLTIHEDYAGLFVHFWNPAPAEKAYQRQNEALKAYLEKR